MKRCFYFQRPNCPIVAVKYNNGELEVVKALMSVKDIYDIMKEYKDSSYLIQRYIYPINNQACKYRIEYLVADSLITSITMKNPLDVFGNRIDS